MSWKVLRTKPRHEIKVADRLHKNGLNVYCPVVEEIRQWSDRKKKIKIPLFSSYIFILADGNENMVYNDPGISGFLNWLGKPAILRDEEIEAIKKWLDKDNIDEFKVSQLEEGELIELKGGTFKGQDAIIEKIDSKQLKLILPEMGWKITANIQDVI